MHICHSGELEQWMIWNVRDLSAGVAFVGDVVANIMGTIAVQAETQVRNAPDGIGPV